MDWRDIVLETPRLLLRPWREEDAPALYRYARDPRVGPAAGWPAHKSVEESLESIRGVLSQRETYAVLLRGETEPVGSVGLILEDRHIQGWRQGDGEVGYWVGVPFWGRGYIPEAVGALLRRAFEELSLNTMWCGYYHGNEKSRRCQLKCGFLPHHSQPDMPVPALGEIRTEHFTRLTREEWLAQDRDI